MVTSLLNGPTAPPACASSERIPFLKEWEATALAVLLLVMFLFSYRKPDYITKRVKTGGQEEMSVVKSISVGAGDTFYVTPAN